MLYPIDGSADGSTVPPPAKKPSALLWLIATVVLHALYLAFAIYLVEERAYDLWPALGISFGSMVLVGAALRLVMPASHGGWHVTLPLVRLGKAILRPWLQPQDALAVSSAAETGTAPNLPGSGATDTGGE
ncbi:hypothetical protein [Actinomadura sp. 9N215]|uniref:hypothetical protein n=1 Tax=Actinomadura sp. 9N215 TaxID=3375150 RepID=UPI0037BE0839